MKKGKVFGKRQIVLATLVLCLAAAVWLNMRFSSLEDTEITDPTDTSLGDGQYINNDDLGVAVQTSAGVTQINNARSERDSTREKTVAELKATTEKAEAEAGVKNDALATITRLTETANAEVAIETVIKAKGFEDALCMISDESVTVIVPSDSLLTSQTLQIQDAVTSQIKIDLEKIKIITVK